MGKHITLTTNERATLNRLFKRKLISRKAYKQIHTLLLLDRNAKMDETAEQSELSFQTIIKHREAFKEKRLDSLLIFLEKNVENEKKKPEPEKKEIKIKTKEELDEEAREYRKCLDFFIRNLVVGQTGG